MHILIYASRRPVLPELPLALFEFGTVYVREVGRRARADQGRAGSPRTTRTSSPA